MSKFRQHKLHSGPGGPIVKSKAQATAIKLSYLRKEGHDIPKPKGSFQEGGLVPETGIYNVHQGELVVPAKGELGYQPGPEAPKPFDFHMGRPHGNPTLEAERAAVNAPLMQTFQQGGLVPETGPAELHKGEVVVPRIRTGVFPETDTSMPRPSPRMQFEPRNVSRIVVEGIDEPIRKKR